MNSLSFLLAPIVLALPAVAELRAVDPRGTEPQGIENVARAAPVRERTPLSAEPAGEAPDILRILDRWREILRQNQVRIEQRVIIRISPSPPSAANQIMSTLPRRPLRQSYQEERLDGCVPIDGIVGVQPAESRLLLFMRDRRVVSVALERSCSARQFYSGFYIERSRDGQLCSRRDKLQSRAGASCEVTQLSRLIAVRD